MRFEEARKQVGGKIFPGKRPGKRRRKEEIGSMACEITFKEGEAKDLWTEAEEGGSGGAEENPGKPAKRKRKLWRKLLACNVKSFQLAPIGQVSSYTSEKLLGSLKKKIKAKSLLWVFSLWS